MKKLIKIFFLLFISVFFLLQFGIYRELPTLYAASPCDEYSEFPGIVPSGFAEYTSKGKFNKKLWYQRNVKVYGCVFSFSDANDFAPGSQSDPSDPLTYNSSAGYYSKNSISGEYRFHGYDAAGNKYINLQFRNDANSKTKLIDKRWIYHPWDELSNSLLNKPTNPGTVFGFDNPEDPVYNKFRNTVSQSIGFPINNGIKLSDPSYPLGSDANPLAYTLINQAPDTRTPGQATMWHQSSSGKIWYQSFNLKPLTDTSKNPAIVEAGVTVNEISPIPKTGKAIQKVKTTVTGTLKDELTYSLPSKSLLNYTRKDIDYWTISVGSEPEQKIYSVRNIGTAVFNLTVPMDMLTVDNKYTTVARTTVHYFNGATAYDEASFTIQFNAVIPAGSFNTRFNVNSPIVFTQHSDLVTSRLEYQDASAGEFVKYDITITQGTSQTFTYNTSKLDDNTVNTDLFNVIKSRFTAGPPPANPIQKTFTIEQKATTTNGGISTYTQEVVVTQQQELPVVIDPDPTIAEKWYDMVPFPASDSTTGYTSRTVTIDGLPVNANTFFSGQYVFGIGNHGLHEIVCKWFSPDGSEYLYSMWAAIYDTKPKVQMELSGIPKENRKMTALNTSASANDPYVADVYPLSYTFTFVTIDGAGSSLRTRTNTVMLKEFMYKTPGIYALKITASNSLGRVSDEYITHFEVFKDEKPAIILHPYNSQVARGDKVQMYYDVVVTDGDQIASKYVKVFYDSDNNGSYDQLLDSYTGSLTEYATPAGKLGKFKLESYAMESTTQETLSEFLDGTEHKSNTAVNYFEVENYQPSSDLFIDYPIAKPFVDLYFMLDASLNTTQANYILGNKVTNINKLINENTLPAVDNWDMHTYTYSQGASTSVYSNTSYPSSMMGYSSGGYSGTLYLSSVGNSPTSTDSGTYVTTTSYQTFSASCTNTRSSVSPPLTTSDSASCGGSWPINSGGYSGSIPATGTVNTVPYSCQTTSGLQYCSSTWVKSYSGTLSKSSTVWQPNWVTTNHYTGYYSGTIYKSVRQPYNNSFFRTISDKYLVYMADNTISQLSDLQNVVSNHDAKVILIGAEAMRTQIAHDYFILNNKSADLLVNDVITHILQSNPPTAQVVSLVGDPVVTITTEVDFDEDPMMNSEMMIYQDANYFDNSQGLMAGLTNNYASSQWETYVSPTSFSKPGKYTMLRRIKDTPSTNPSFASYAYWSNVSQVDIIVHRKPIADVIFDYDYDVDQNNYRTRWLDQSYDLDHNVTRALSDKGIIDRALSLYNHSTGATMFTIPSRLYPGSYTLTYAAKDMEGAWSDTITENFVLSSTPPIQFTGSAKTESSSFAMSGVPASENLLAYNLWTRYPYAVSLQFTIGTNTHWVPYYTGVKTGNDISWLDKIITIPNTTIDGNYNFRIDAIGSGGGSSFLTFPVTVFTPIHLIGQITDAQGAVISNGLSGYPELVVGEAYQLKASTTKYPINTTARVFKGSLYANSQVLTATVSGANKNWNKSYTIPAMVDGIYSIVWTAATPSGKTQLVTKLVKVINNRPPVAKFDWQPKPVWEGSQVNLLNQSRDPDTDPLTYLWEVTAPNGVISSSTAKDYSLTFHQSGQYIVKLQVFDGIYTSSLSQSVSSNSLTIDAAVQYTPQWLLHHQDSGHNTTVIPKEFYSGEIFVVETITSPVPVQEIKAWIDTSGIDGSLIKASVILVQDQGFPTHYKGELYDAQFMSFTRGLSEGLQQIHFQIKYSNGVVKQQTVPVDIIGNVNEAIGVHRRQ